MAQSQTLETLVFQGTLSGTVTLQAQPLAGNGIIQLPNINGLVGQNLQIVGITGAENNVLQLGFVTPTTGAGQPVNLSQLTQSGAALNEVIQWNGTAWVPSAFVPGAGTVTSVAVTVPAWLAVAGSPITTNGTIAITSAPSLTANWVLATPNGVAGVLSPRALVAADIPALPYDAAGAAATAQSNAEAFATAGDSTTLATAEAYVQTFTPVSNEFLTGYNSGTGTFSAGQASFAGLSGSLAVSQINSKVGTGNAVQLSNTGQTIVAGDVLTYTADGSVQDSAIASTALVLTTGSYADPTWITSLAGAKISGNITGNAASITGSIAESQVTNLVSDLALKATLASPTFTGTVTLPAAVNATSGSDLIVTQTGANKVRITTATGVFDFLGTGGGMNLSTQNATIAIDLNGAISMSSATGQKISLVPNTVVNISNVPGPYANNAAATGAGLTAGDVYYTATDPRTLAVVF